MATFDRRSKNCFQVSCKKVIYSRFHTEYINTSILNNFNIRFPARRFEKEVKIYFLNSLEVTPSVWNQAPSPIFPFIFKAPNFHIFRLRLSVFLNVILQTHTDFHFTFTPDIQFIQLCNFKYWRVLICACACLVHYHTGGLKSEFRQRIFTADDPIWTLFVLVSLIPIKRL